MSAPGPYPVSRDQQPGLFPLRPLTVGELLTGAVRVAVRNLWRLAPLALLIGALGTAAEIGILAATGTLDTYASGTWAVMPAVPTDAWVTQFLNTFGKIMLGAAASLLITLIGSPVLAGLATPLAGEAAITTTPRPSEATARLRGRWAGLVGAALLAGLATAAGFVAFILPGVLLWIALMLTGPVAAMEGSTPRSTLTRALELSRGFRPRLFGVALLAALFSLIAALVVSALVGAVIRQSGEVSVFVVAQIIGVVIGAFTGAWTATVTALLYVDIRIRKEGLADALRPLIATRRPQHP